MKLKTHQFIRSDGFSVTVLCVRCLEQSRQACALHRSDSVVRKAPTRSRKALALPAKGHAQISFFYVHTFLLCIAHTNLMNGALL